MCNILLEYSQRYICTDCWNELNDLRSEWPEDLTEIEVRNRIDAFMDSPAGCNKVGTDEAFKRLTGMT